MLTDKLAAKLADNLCFLGDFATSMDYLCDDEGNLVAEYNVPLDLVAGFIAANDQRLEGRYLSLGYELNRG